jgi:hypothetical protein
LLSLVINTAHCSPIDIWRPNWNALNPDELQKTFTSIDTEAAHLAPELKPAVDFQKTFLQIISKNKESVWGSTLKRLATDAAILSPGPIGENVKQVSNAWLARAEAVQIDAILKKYYSQHVAFPHQLSEVEADIPEPLRHDPLGGAWVYNLAAPTGMSKLVGQRYHLAPSFAPDLPEMSRATGNRKLSLPTWQIAFRDLAGNKSLEFRNGASVVAIQPGGKVDGYTLLYIGNNWALMSGVDQLFAVTF